MTLSLLDPLMASVVLSISRISPPITIITPLHKRQLGSNFPRNTGCSTYNRRIIQPRQYIDYLESILSVCLLFYYSNAFRLL
uniref:Uncharacterized protein n=1 Tax=Hyaloperonospora arabidopsidis (strain Emoy2) TaxID=559515 RepID=M4BW03_HYAAE